jgi:hypothetical protein
MNFIGNVLVYALPDADSVAACDTPEGLQDRLLRPPTIFARELWTSGYLSPLDVTLHASAVIEEHFFVGANGKVCALDGSDRPGRSPDGLSRFSVSLVGRLQKWVATATPI